MPQKKRKKPDCRGNRNHKNQIFSTFAGEKLTHNTKILR